MTIQFSDIQTLETVVYNFFSHYEAKFLELYRNEYEDNDFSRFEDAKILTFNIIAGNLELYPGSVIQYSKIEELYQDIINEFKIQLGFANSDEELDNPWA